MKLLLLALFGASAYAALDQKCLEQEFLANGYVTGQNIEMNYEASEIKTVDSKTILHLEFFVPKRYTEQHEANSFALTFNRATGENSLSKPDDHADDGADQWKDDVRQFVDEVDGKSQGACYSNRYANYSHCLAPEDGLWTFSQNADNDCVMDAKADLGWTDVFTTMFAGIETQINGNWIEIFLTATVETWTHFSQGKTGEDGEIPNYKGVMNGAEQWLNKGDPANANNRQGEYGNDAGWLGWPGDSNEGDFGDIIIDDERKTLYQIPFILRFPRSVMVETSFRAMQDITLLTGVVGQDVIQVNLNPGDDGVFATVEAVLTTQVQYPFGIRGPDDKEAPMTVVVGSDEAGGADHAASVEFIHYDEESSCMMGEQDFSDGRTCEQSFKFRMTPGAGNPCSVAGDYTFEMWAQCVAHKERDMGGEHDPGCPIDDLVNDDSVENRRKSNSYFKMTVTIDHQEFCPELLDEVRVVADFTVYKDEKFLTAIDNDVDNSHDKMVFTNDMLFYEAVYRTASAESGENIEDNNPDQYGDASIIDYVRPTRVFMDVTIGLNRAGDALPGWKDDDWAGNMDFSPLGGKRIPGVEIAGDDIVVSLGADGDGSAAKYNILLCEAVAEDPAKIQWGVAKPTYCFADIKDTATNYLDFEQVIRSLDGAENEIKENEVAFKMRMDERILPIKPANDESFVTVTLQSEIYYRGNRHPSRRLLQAEPALSPSRSQSHSMSVGYSILSKAPIDTCVVANDQEFGQVRLQFAYESQEAMPTAGDMSSFVSELSMQIDEYHHVRDSVEVEKVERCNGNCSLLYARGPHGVRRRAEVDGAHLNVYLNFKSVKSNKAGQIMNVFQANVANSKSDMHKKVNLFVDAAVADMKIDGCNADFESRNYGDLRRDREDMDDMMDLIKEQSGVSRPTAVLALALTLLYLW